jgi:hypothetical protein
MTQSQQIAAISPACLKKTPPEEDIPA